MITIMDIMNGALKAATKNYAYLEAYIAAAIIYWVICLSIEQLARVLEIRMGRFRKRML
jgi:L-cystine transport system permease protein